MDHSTVKKAYLDIPVWQTAILLAAVLLICLALVPGLWWFTILVGIVLGGVLRRGRVALLFALLAGGAGWGACLLIQARTLPLASTASLVAEVSGLGGTAGWVVLALPVLLGMLLCLCGAWLALAIRSLLRK
jgi:hypothetical protein